MSRLATLAVLASLAAAPLAMAEDMKNSPAGATKAATVDTKFIHEAAAGGMAEVELGKLAAKNAASADVKAFGQHMVDDHSKANDELMSIVKSKGMDAPAALDAEHQKAVQKLSSMTGASFDKAYMTQMVADHKKTISLFEKEANSGKDADVKAFAAKTLPTLKEHLKMAQDTAKAAKS